MTSLCISNIQPKYSDQNVTLVDEAAQNMGVHVVSNSDSLTFFMSMNGKIHQHGTNPNQNRKDDRPEGWKGQISQLWSPHPCQFVA